MGVRVEEQAGGEHLEGEGPEGGGSSASVSAPDYRNT